MARVLTDFDRENNPYLLIWLEVDGGLQERMIREAFNPETFEKWFSRSFKAFATREESIHQFGFAIPDHLALMSIKSHCPTGVTEIGAGTGYWAHLLEKSGVEVCAYDSGRGVKQHGFSKEWTTIHKGRHTDALAVPQNHERALLLCWPSLGDSWAHEALKLYRGNTVIYVGEWHGCTANEDFHDELENNWDEVVDYEIPQWWGIHDRMWIFERRLGNGGP